MNIELPKGNGNWKTQTYVMGGIVGLAFGLLSAYLFARASEEQGKDIPERVKTLDALKLTVALLGIARQITDLGSGPAKK